MSGDRLALGMVALLAAAGVVRRGSRSWDEDDEWESEHQPPEMTSIPVGTMLYHGTQAPASFTYPTGAAWVSDSEAVAQEFVAWNQWEDTGRRRILVYEVVAEIDQLPLIAGPSDMKALVESLYLDDHMGPIELAEAVCAAGYNGWHIPHNYPSGSDTMLCEPERWLEFIEEREL